MIVVDAVIGVVVPDVWLACVVKVKRPALVDAVVVAAVVVEVSSDVDASFVDAVVFADLEIGVVLG